MASALVSSSSRPVPTERHPDDNYTGAREFAKASKSAPTLNITMHTVRSLHPLLAYVTADAAGLSHRREMPVVRKDFEGLLDTCLCTATGQKSTFDAVAMHQSSIKDGCMPVCIA